MGEHTENLRLAVTDILTPEFIFAAICSLASQFVSQNAEAIAKATEKVMQTYQGLNTNISSREIRENNNSTHTSLFDMNVAIDSTLSPVDKAVYHVLLVLADNETHQCSPKVETIAKKASCSESAVRKSLATLEKHCLIRRQFRYISHRQISSLYTIIGPQTSSGQQVAEAETQSNTMLAETDKKVSNTTVSNTTEHNPAYFLGDTKKRASLLPEEDNTLHQKEGDNTLHQKEGEKKESFKESLREGGASLPAIAEKSREEPNAVIPEEVTPREKPKDSLTGGALLPKPTGLTPTPQAPTPPAETSETATSTSTPPAKPLLIRGESEGTPHGDTAHGTPVEAAKGGTLKFEGETLREALAAGKTFEQWAWEHHERQEKEYAEFYAARRAAEQAAEQAAAEQAARDGRPQPGTPEFWQWKFEQSRKNCEAMLGHPLETPEPKLVASEIADVLADIKREPAIKSESAEPAEESEPPAAQLEAECVAPAASVAPATTEDIPEAKTACDAPMSSPNPADEASEPAEEPAETASADPAEKPSAAKNPGKKKSAKSKSSYDGSAKDIYSPDYAPEVMRATAELFLLKTGRRGFRWEEISVLRKLSATHFPTVVNKEILRACARFEKRNQSLKCLTMMYIEAALKNWSPTYGRKKKAKAEVKTEPVEKPKTEAEREAELAQARAEMEEIRMYEEKWAEERRQKGYGFTRKVCEPE